MNLIAIKDFLRVPALKGIEFGKQIHPNFVAKGTRFAIGDFTADQINTKPITPDKQLLAMLMVSRSATEDTPEARAAVEAELELERKKEANHARLDQLAAARYAEQLSIARTLAAEELSRRR